MEALWQTMQFWKKPSMTPIEGKHYELVNFKESDITGVEILKGKFKGVIYHYTGARVAQNPGDPIPRLQFGYNLVETGTHDQYGLQDDDEFVTMLGDILTNILTNEADYNESFRTLNPEEFDLQ
jgi:hypothetical protein